MPPATLLGYRGWETRLSAVCGQVHRAVLQLGGEPRQVVVKVRHPGVARNITIDFRLLKPVAAAASRIPSLKGLSLKESLAQFSANMTAQVRGAPCRGKQRMDMIAIAWAAMYLPRMSRECWPYITPLRSSNCAVEGHGSQWLR